MISIVTFNVGILRRFGGLLQPTPHLNERLQAMPAVLRDSGADIVALQEIYDEAHRRTVREAVQPTLPFSASDPTPRWPRLSSGLLTLARQPLSSCFQRFTVGPREETWLTARGMLLTTISLTGGGALTLVNVHTTAGGLFSHPESARQDALRARQLEALFALAANTAGVPVIAGDLNSGPGVSDANYRAFEVAGWVDVHAALHPGTSDITWDPTNPLNIRGPHGHCPPQRIDHVFVRRSDVATGTIVPRSSEVVFTRAQVRTASGAVSMSDHYGLRVEVDFPTNKAAS